MNQVLFTNLPAVVELSLLLLNMPAGALHVLLLLQLRYVTPVMTPQDSGSSGVQDGPDVAQLGLRESASAPVVASHRKTPSFMLDMFNSVSGSGDTQRSQEEILKGNIVRSLEAKGE